LDQAPASPWQWRNPPARQRAPLDRCPSQRRRDRNHAMVATRCSRRLRGGLAAFGLPARAHCESRWARLRRSPVVWPLPVIGCWTALRTGARRRGGPEARAEHQARAAPVGQRSPTDARRARLPPADRVSRRSPRTRRSTLTAASGSDRGWNGWTGAATEPVRHRAGVLLAVPKGPRQAATIVVGCQQGACMKAGS
jgi:hypothetical protein